MSGILEQLKFAGGDALDSLEEIRRDIGRTGYATQNEAIRLSKLAIIYLKRGDLKGVTDAKAKIRASINELDNANIPTAMRVRFIETVAQEFVELCFVEALYPRLSDEEAPVNLTNLTPEALDVSIQAWFAGLLDVPGELSKLALDERLKTVSSLPSVGDQVDSLRRLVVLLREIAEYLSEFETAYEAAITNSSGHNRFWQTFRGKLLNVRKMLMEREEELLSLSIMKVHWEDRV